MTAIGFIGLGAMGGRMAGRLVAAGHEVYGNNRTASKAAGLVERGLRWRDTPRGVAEAANVIFSMVSDDAALDTITSGPDGILAGLDPSKIYVDMSTVSPRASRELAERVRALGARMLDAPVSGSVPAAEDGSLAIMVGGPQETFRTVEPLLRQLGRTITHVGGNGQGLVLKLAINISLGAQTLAFSEGLLLAVHGGIDPKLAAGVMAGSAIGSPAVKARAPLMLDLPEAAWFDVRLMQKDIRLALQAGDALGIPLPAAATTDEILTEAREQGYGGRDIAALFHVLTRMSGAPGSAGAAPSGESAAVGQPGEKACDVPPGATGRSARC
ncbi:NAD(P)-dependent oxidoreductase [Kitasatospora sp. GP82]|uniref:NAD(P)-dependent oxidoreductase n=1 Tax=Kitasatospora sp. GP82 TaxID=3035089 RepID=UPI0024753644|nr:NAD(P)-dependent oxidoreductase [Kitasatospora sp. GP82]MDH6130109.1 3-hydroxyisobutyrate dehydrogenase-like beta-hydroxyacid dehydrogenase [Kitasatospora sp. GP82]